MMFHPIRKHFDNIRSHLEATRGDGTPLDPELVGSVIYLSAAAVTALFVLLALAVVTAMLIWIYILLAIIGIFI